jgi:flavodoxin I
MKTLVIFDSLYGNTEQIAKAIGGAIDGEVKVVKVGEANPAELSAYDLVLIGSPTQGGRYTKGMGNFLGKIPADAIKNKSVAAFDTRIKGLWVKISGNAAKRIEDNLKEKGANLVAPAEGFVVKGAKGPLAEGEAERAAAWAKGIADKK